MLHNPTPLMKLCSKYPHVQNVGIAEGSPFKSLYSTVTSTPDFTEDFLPFQSVDSYYVLGH